MGPQLHDCVVISLNGKAQLRVFEASVMAFVSLKKSLDGDMAALIFWDFSTGNEVFAVVSVQSGVNHLLRHGCASDMLNPKGCVGVSVYEAASQRRFAAGRKVEPWNA